MENRFQLINNLHPNLSFTLETEINGKIAFLDMIIYNDNGSLSSGWYRKQTDTGLTLNYHSLAPTKYKKSVIISYVYRIFRACSNWHMFHKGISEAIEILSKNQYPQSFIMPIISNTIRKLVSNNDQSDTESESVGELNVSLDSNAWLNNMKEKDKFKFFISYRGNPTENLANAFRKLNAPCKIIMTTRKIKYCLPSLKPTVPKMLMSKVVYKITCPGCESSYVGQTIRHVQRRLSEHLGNNGTMKVHFDACNVKDHDNSILQILHKSNSLNKLLALEALYIQEIKPNLNKKDEYRSRTLTLKIF